VLSDIPALSDLSESSPLLLYSNGILSLWARYGESLYELANSTNVVLRDHTQLTSIGTNTHAQIDTNIASVRSSTVSLQGQLNNVAVSTTSLQGQINNLQNNTTNYVPYTGAIYDVNLGTHTIQANDYDFPQITVSTPLPNILRLYAIADDGFTVLQTVENSGEINRLNQDTFRIARNTSGTDITKGQAVYYTGSTDNKPNFSLAISSNEATMPAIAITKTAVANNNFGEIMIIGRLTGIKTNYAGWTEGNQLYVSSSTLGGLTNVRPLHPNLAQWIGTIEVVHAVNGVILVNCQSLTGIEDGTNRNTYTLGNTQAGTKSVKFSGTSTGQIDWDSTVSSWTVSSGNIEVNGDINMSSHTLTGSRFSNYVVLRDTNSVDWYLGINSGRPSIQNYAP
ncbi:MAG: hypothetical protein WC390_09215, partial [Sulfurimonas sp.]